MATVVLVAAVMLLLGIAASNSTGRRTRRAGRRPRLPQRATVIGVLVLGVVLGAAVAGGRIAHAVAVAVVAIGHLLAGMLA